ncbi:hypothetical protein HD806DRAFT_536104 [Xylariaceae sp. AK1471]|nr:hypothetical protein HD806DRAFT_536104 [Xylariaceae sp. AK1471]
MSNNPVHRYNGDDDRDDALRAIGDHPKPVQFFVDQLKSSARRCNQVLEESRSSFSALLDHVISELVQETETRNDLLRRGIYATRTPAPPSVEAIPSSNNVTVIDLTSPTGPQCSTCQIALKSSRTTADSDCGCLACDTCAPANKFAQCDTEGHEDVGWQDTVRIYGLFDPCKMCQGTLRWPTRPQNCGKPTHQRINAGI